MTSLRMVSPSAVFMLLPAGAGDCTPTDRTQQSRSTSDAHGGRRNSGAWNRGQPSRSERVTNKSLRGSRIWARQKSPYRLN